MTSNGGNFNPSSSQPSSSVPPASESSGGKAPKEKMKVTIENDGSVVGEYSKIWSSRTGDFVRNHIPISYNDWRKVPKNFKDDVWNALMRKENPDKHYSRVEKWLAAHEHSDGSVLESAKSKYDEIKAIENLRKSSDLTDEGYSNNCEDFDNDELTQVFGKDKREGVRAVGSRISKRQLLHIGLPMSKSERKKKITEEVAALEDKIISHVDSKFHDMQGIIMSLVSKLSNVSTPPMVTTPSSDYGSNSVNFTTHLAQNLNNVFATGVSPSTHHMPPTMSPPTDKPPCVLFDKFGKQLTKGHVVTDATVNVCHSKQVGIGEKKVYIEEVFEPEARLWDRQDGQDTLADFVQGGFVIWLECWLKIG